MKLKTTESEYNLTDRIWVLVRKPGFILIMVMILYNILIIGFTISLFYGEVPYSRRQRIIHSIKSNLSVAEILKKPWAQKNTRNLEFDHFMLEVDENDLNGLKSQKLLTDLSDDQDRSHSSSASIIFKDKTYKVNLSLTSQLGVYPEFGEDWSFDVQVDNDNIKGISHFRLYTANKQEYLDKWLLYQILQDYGLIDIQYEFVALSLNGSKSRTYILEEEHEILSKEDPAQQKALIEFEKNLSKKVKRFDSKDLDLSGIQDPALIYSILNSSYKDDKDVLKLFDSSKLAKYCAFLDLYGVGKSLDLEHIGFRLNLKKGLLEPIISIGGHVKSLEEVGLIGSERTIFNKTRHIRKENLTLWNPLDAFFQDKDFYEIYIQTLEEIGASQWLEKMEGLQKFGLLTDILQDEYLVPFSNNVSTVLHNKEFITKAFNPSKQLHVYFNPDKTTDSEIYLEASNIYFFPIEILNATVGDSIHFTSKNSSNLLQANTLLSPVDFLTFSLDIPNDVALNDTLIGGLIIKYKILGTSKIKRERIIPYGIINEDLLNGDLIRQTPNVEVFQFLTISEKERQIVFNQGVHQLRSNLIIPKNYEVLAFPGTKIDMLENVCILSYSPLQFQGSEEDPITIYSSDSSAQGIVVLSNGRESNLNHVKFDNLSHPDQAGWILTSAVTFYESPVIMESCKFENNRKGDDYLNIVRCRYSINNSIFAKVNADAFDGDFSDGVISNTTFIDMGNDAIDVSGSKVIMNNVYIEGAGDKGISAGEDSRIDARDVQIKNSEIAITSKDLSLIKIDNVEIYDSRIAYAAFQKKSEFGPANIQILQHSVVSGKCEILYLIEKGSHLTINDQEVVPSMDLSHVKSILYGVKYGKSSG